MNRIRILDDAQALAQASADHFVTLAAQAIAYHGLFAVALSGGSTPRATYRLLATEEYAGRVNWALVHVFWSDERCVPPDDPLSNFRMARDALLQHVPLPQQNIHRMKGEIAPQLGAAEYDTSLRSFFSGSPFGRRSSRASIIPSFDLVLLGLGTDGHTASLFPGTPAVREKARWVIAHRVVALDQWRLTLTPPIINAAAQVTFIVSGAAKAQTLRRVLRGPFSPEALPAQTVRAPTGRLLWLVDAEAGSLLAD